MRRIHGAVAGAAAVAALAATGFAGSPAQAAESQQSSGGKRCYAIKSPKAAVYQKVGGRVLGWVYRGDWSIGYFGENTNGLKHVYVDRLDVQGWINERHLHMKPWNYCQPHEP